MRPSTNAADSACGPRRADHDQMNQDFRGPAHCLRRRPVRLSLIFPAWCDTFGVFAKVAHKASSFPPLNLAIVATLARQAGWEAQIIDAEVEQLDFSQVLRRVRDFRPDLSA
jgi:hypothetical protein